MNRYDVTNSYNADNYDRICLILPRGSKQRIKVAAASAGKNMSEYIVEMIPKNLVCAWKRERKQQEAQE